MNKSEALKTMEQYANQHKRTYVRVADRKILVDTPVEGTEYKLRLHTKVYSKTWSKTYAYLIVESQCLDIRQSRKYLESK